jgi:hypothetical protein
MFTTTKPKGKVNIEISAIRVCTEDTENTLRLKWLFDSFCEAPSSYKEYLMYFRN